MATRTILSSGRRSSTALALSSLLIAAACAPVERDFGDTTGAGGGGAGSSSSTGGGTCEAGTKTACYEGADGTEGVGLCKAGTKTCGADGIYGACEGQTLPAVDDCMTPEDEDCDGANDACAPLLPLWATGSATAGENNVVRGVAVDAAGNIVAVGMFRGEITLGGTKLISNEAKNQDAFIVKLDPTGKAIWAHAYGTPDSDQEAVGVAIGPDGHIFVAGDFDGAISLGPGFDYQSLGSSDVFVVELDPQGNTVNATFGGGQGGEYAEAIAVDGQGRAVVTGTFYTPFNFGPLYVGDPNGNNTRMFVARFAGALQGLDAAWSGGTGAVRPRAIAVGPNGAVSVCGAFDDVADFPGGQALASNNKNGKDDAFLLQLDAGNLNGLWVHAYGGVEDDRCTGVAVDGLGRATIAGGFQAQAYFGATVLDAKVDEENVFAAQVDAQGVVTWAKSFGGGPLPITTVAAAVDPQGNLTLAGACAGTLNFGGADLPSQGMPMDIGQMDTFVAALDAGGKHLASQRFGSDSAQGFFAVALDPKGYVVAAGATLGEVKIGEDSVGVPDPTVASPIVARFTR